MEKGVAETFLHHTLRAFRPSLTMPGVVITDFGYVGGNLLSYEMFSWFGALSTSESHCGSCRDSVRYQSVPHSGFQPHKWGREAEIHRSMPQQANKPAGPHNRPHRDADIRRRVLAYLPMAGG